MSIKLGWGWVLVNLVLCGPAYAQAVRDSTSEDAAPTTAARGATRSSVDLSQVERLIVEKTNQFRKEHGLGRLRRNQELAKAARSFADYLARTGKFSHTADGKQP
jgi:uncharacterized protein YkwD